MSKHDEIAREIATKHGVKYNKGKGVDVVTSTKAIEVETENSVSEAKGQLSHYKTRTPYVAGVDSKTVKKAKEVYKGTGIGVMDSKGKIVKRGRRKRN